MPGGDGRGSGGGNAGRGRMRESGCGWRINAGMKNRMLPRKMSFAQSSSQLDPQQTISENQELEILKQQAQMFQDQMNSILHRIDKLDKDKQKTAYNRTSIKAFVIEEKCTGCEICADVCKRGAITVMNTAHIDLEKCTGCGVCIDSCPNEALILK